MDFPLSVNHSDIIYQILQALTNDSKYHPSFSYSTSACAIVCQLHLSDLSDQIDYTMANK